MTTAPLTSTGPGTWTAPDGYRVVRHTADDGYVTWRVHRPGERAYCAGVDYLREARDVVTALRLSNGECPNLHLIRTEH